METVYGILFLVALVVVSILWGKAKDAASKAANQKLFHRTEYEEGKRILAGLTFETKAPTSAVMRELQAQVEVSDGPNAVVGRLYEALRTDDRIDYTYGNKFGDSFNATVVLSSQDGETIGHFRIKRWHEQDGIISFQDPMRALRTQVKAAFKAADPDVRILEGLLDDLPTAQPSAAAPVSEAAAGGPAEETV